MAHFHTFNPWANTLIYVPDIMEALAHDPETASFYAQEIETRHKGKVDLYILPQPSGYHSFGIRYGEEPREYYSPSIAPTIAELLITKYSNTGA